MNLQSIVNINVDFYDKKYILVNAKQLDKGSRFLLVTCYNHGQSVILNKGNHSAYIRYKKADDFGAFNFCDITNDGKIKVELTEQMLAADGMCYAELVIVKRGGANVNTETGEIINIDNTFVLSTMTFCIDVSEIVIENTTIESSYEFDGLNTALEKAEAEYAKVSQLSRSYAIGNAGKIRVNEDTDNSKYYSEQAYLTAVDANASKNNAKESESKALEYMESAKEYMDVAQAYALEINNKLDAMVEAYSPMGTITYAELKELHTNGTMSAGHLYNISDTFTTEDTPPFKLGVGVECAAGSNVYYTADGYWDVLIGSSVAGVKGDAETNYRIGNINLTAENIGAISIGDIATIDEIKEYLGI